MRSSTWAGSVRLQPRRPTISWATSPAAWVAGRGRGFCPSSLLWWDPTRSPTSSSGALSTGQTWSCWSGARGGHSHDPRAATPLLWGKAERVGALRPGEHKAPGRPYCGFSALKGAYKKDGDRLFSRACCDRTRDNGPKLKEGRFRFGMRKTWLQVISNSLRTFNSHTEKPILLKHQKSSSLSREISPLKIPDKAIQKTLQVCFINSVFTTFLFIFSFLKREAHIKLYTIVVL